MLSAHRCALTACAVLSVAGSARSEPAAGPVELVWAAPAGCPSALVVRQRAERILSRTLSTADGTLLSILANVSAPSATEPWRVTLELDTGHRRASRTVQAASCEELANATAVFLAILIEPELDEVQPEDRLSALSESTKPTAQAPLTSAPPVSDATPAPGERRAGGDDAASTSLQGSLGAVTGARSDLLPHWTPGLGLHGALSWRLLRTSLGASAWLPARATLDADHEAGAKLQLSSAYSELCVRIQTPTLTPAVCGGGELELLRGSGFGPGVEEQSRTAAFVSLTGGGSLLVPFSRRGSLLLDVDVVLPMGSRRFVFDGRDSAVIFEPAAGVRLTCGAEWSL